MPLGVSPLESNQPYQPMPPVIMDSKESNLHLWQDKPAHCILKSTSFVLHCLYPFYVCKGCAGLNQYLAFTCLQHHSPALNIDFGLRYKPGVPQSYCVFQHESYHILDTTYPSSYIQFQAQTFHHLHRCSLYSMVHELIVELNPILSTRFVHALTEHFHT